LYRAPSFSLAFGLSRRVSVRVAELIERCHDLIVGGIRWLDGGTRLQVATGKSRRDSLLSAAVVPFLAYAFVFGSDESGSSGVPVSAVRTHPVLAAYVIAVGVVGAWLLARAALVRTTLSSDGIVVRNLFRTYRLSWNEVRLVGDRSLPASRHKRSAKSTRVAGASTWAAAISTTTKDAGVECVATRCRVSNSDDTVEALKLFLAPRAVRHTFGAPVGHGENGESDGVVTRPRTWSVANLARAATLGAVAVGIGVLGAWWFAPTHPQPALSADVPTSTQPSMSADLPASADTSMRDYASGKTGVTVTGTHGGFRAVFPSRPQISTNQSAGLTLTTYTSTVSDGGVSLAVSPWPSDFSRGISELKSEALTVTQGTVIATRTRSFDRVPALETLVHDPANDLYDEELAFITPTQWFTLDVTGAQNPPAGYRRFIDELSAR
jgi:hypothetical protein